MPFVTPAGPTKLPEAVYVMTVGVPSPSAVQSVPLLKRLSLPPLAAKRSDVRVAVAAVVVVPPKVAESVSDVSDPIALTM